MISAASSLSDQRLNSSVNGGRARGILAVHTRIVGQKVTDHHSPSQSTARTV